MDNVKRKKVGNFMQCSISFSERAVSGCSVARWRRIYRSQCENVNLLYEIIFLDIGILSRTCGL